MSYTWSEFYEKELERLKEKNDSLAFDLAKETRWYEETNAYKELIEHNLFYKFYKPYETWKKKRQANKEGELKNGTIKALTFSGDEWLNSLEGNPDYVKDYDERIKSITNRYDKWVRFVEPKLWDEKEKEVESADPSYEKKVSIVPYRNFSKLKKLTAETPYILFVEDENALDAKAIPYLEKYLSLHPETEVLYGGEDYVDQEGNRSDFYAKPSYSPSTLFSNFYFGSYFLVRTKTALEVKLVGDKDARVNLYDFVLKLCHPFSDLKFFVKRVDLILYHRQDKPFTPWGYEETYVPLKKRYLKSLGIKASESCAAGSDIFAVRPDLPEEHLVSVVIPSKDNPEYLKKCIGSLTEGTTYQNIEIIVVDNGSSEEHKKEIETYLKELPATTLYLYEKMEFNFSKMCNIGANRALGEYILLLNDDIEIIESNWLTNMVRQSMLPGTGAVGAKLWYGLDKRIQHAGVSIVEEGPVHKLVTLYDEGMIYFGTNVFVQDKSAVTGACLLVKTSDYHRVGGLDESFAVAYNDVDFCLKLHKKGLFNVFCADAVLLHHESVSRGYDEVSKEKFLRMTAEWNRLKEKYPTWTNEDPFYSSILFGASSSYEPKYYFPGDRLSSTKVVLTEASVGNSITSGCTDKVSLAFDKVSKTFSTSSQEKDAFYITGWSYFSDIDNNYFERKIVLRKKDSEKVYFLNLYDRERPIVKRLLGNPIHGDSIGFSAYLPEGRVEAGEYEIGILYFHRELNRFAVKFKEETISLN